MKSKDNLVFSIIIPVFNTKINYFRECLRSINDNNLNKKQFEVIIINDGMENFDDYNQIIDNHLKKNNIQVKIINNPLNMKQGYSRYLGLKKAKGEYVHFVDSDDEIFPYTYTKLINYLKDEPNFIMFKEDTILAEVDESQQEYVFKNLTKGLKTNELENHIFSKKDLSKIRNVISLVLHSKVFNKLWLLENSKLYVPNLYMEDVLLTVEILLKTEKFKVCLDKLYRYNYYNTGSTMVIKNNKLFFDSLIVFDKIFEMISLENRWELRHLLLDNILGFYSYYDKFSMKGKFDLFFIEILKKYKNMNFKFINKKHYQWFKGNEKLKNLFSRYILNEKDLFFQKMLDVSDDETVLPSDKHRKDTQEVVEKEFKLDDNLINKCKTNHNSVLSLESLFLSSIIFTLTKFTYSKKILITKLYEIDDKIEKIIFACDIDTSLDCQSFQDDVLKQNSEITEYKYYFQKYFKDYNDVRFPDFQFYYQKQNNITQDIPESNFTIVINEKMNAIKIKYNSSLYSPKMVDLFADSFLIVLKNFIYENKVLSDISIGPSADEIVNEKTINSLESYMHLNSLFKQIVAENKDKIALITNDKSLTFDELNHESNKVANSLIKNGLKTEDRVIISLNRDSNLIVAIFGVIKAGGIFILVNPNDPKKRIDFIKKDTQAKFTINNNNKTENTLNTAINTSNIVDLLKNQNNNDPNLKLDSDSGFCITYTSGSTGSPKGVLQTQGSILNKGFLDGFQFNKNDIYLLSTNQAFIPFIETLILFLYHGVTIFLTSEDKSSNPQKIADIFDEVGFNIMFTTPSILEEYLEDNDMKKVFKKIKMVFLAGEKLNLNLVRKVKEISDLKLYDWYGSSETLVSNLNLIVDDKIFVGKPVANVLETVMDIDGNPLPHGIVGELWVGGFKIAKEYYNNEKLTQERFTTIKDIPFFKSGDLAKCGENEEYTIFGRVDNQIKLRGQRINPSEIENNIPKEMGLKKSIVTINKKNNNQYLTLYFTTYSTKEKSTKDDTENPKKRLKNHFKSVLPQFMVPQNYVHLDEFPKTKTGKIKIKDLQNNYENNTKENIKPSTKLEQKIFNLCADILGYDDFGVTNNLLSIGFTSLSIIKLLNKIIHKHHISLQLKDLIYGDIDIKNLSKRVEDQQKILIKNGFKKNYSIDYSKSNNDSILINQKVMPLNPNQLIYYDYIKKDHNQFHIVKLISFKNIDVFNLRDALLKTIELNSYLKTCLCDDNGIYQKRNDNYEVYIKIFNKKLTEEIERKFIKPFNMFEPPLFRFELYYQDNEVNLLLDVHHIISDLHSINIFINDLIKNYLGNTPTKEYDYFDYVSDQISISSLERNKSKNYFVKQIKDFPMELYMDPLPIKEEYGLKFKSIVYENDLSEFLREHTLSESDMFLSATVICLTKFLNTNNILINFVFDGRFDDTKFFNVFGYFARSIPLFLEVDPNVLLKDFPHSMKNLKKSYIHNSYNYNPEKLIKNYLNSKRKMYVNINILDLHQTLLHNNKKVDFSVKNIPTIGEKIKDKSYFFSWNKESNDFELSLGYTHAYNYDFEIDNLLQNIVLVLNLMVNNPLLKIGDLPF